MFLKVFKYDIKAVAIKFLPILLILPILGVVVRLVNLIEVVSSVSTILITLMNFLFIFGCMFMAIYTFVICVQRYVRSLFKDQGYLTHTLPVGKNTLLCSQLLVVFVMTILSALWIYISILIAYANSESIRYLMEVLSEWFDYTFEVYPAEVTVSLISFVVGSIQSILVLFLGIALGHSHAKNKTMLSVVYCIAFVWGINMLTQSINLSISDSLINETFRNGWLVLQIASIVEGCIVIVVAYILTVYIMNKRLNLE